MSTDAEYKDGMPLEEPEHPDRGIINRFFNELADGDPSGAAEALLDLHDAGGSLCETDLQLVADLFDDKSALGTAFPYRLEFAKRGRGRPRRVPQSQLKAPWNAFASGDEVKVSEALSELDALGGTDLEILAGLLGDDPALHAHFPWRLVLRNPRRGKPKKMDTEARQFRTALIAGEARRRHEHKHIKRAIGEVCDQTNLSRATVYKAEKAMRDKSRIR